MPPTGRGHYVSRLSVCLCVRRQAAEGILRLDLPSTSFSVFRNFHFDVISVTILY